MVNGGGEPGNVPFVRHSRANFIEGWITRGDIFTETSGVQFRHSEAMSLNAASREAVRSGRTSLADTCRASLRTLLLAAKLPGRQRHQYPALSCRDIPGGSGRPGERDHQRDTRPWQQFPFGFTALSGPRLPEVVNFRAAFSLENVPVVEIAAIPEPAPRCPASACCPSVSKHQERQGRIAAWTGEPPVSAR